MAKPENQFENLAREAEARLQRQRAVGEQLVLLPDERHGTAKGDGEARPVRGKGKAMSQMREWLTARGYRLPEEVLAELAGLTAGRGETVFAQTMREVEALLLWAYDGAEIPKGAPKGPTASKRLDLFQQLLVAKLRAADALMPYGAPKATPDVAVTNVNQVVVQAPAATAPQPVRAGDRARDVTPQARRITPPLMPHETQQNQDVSGSARRGSDE
ncbi:MAG: hypothetical protein PHX82_05000 [Paracoccaceae bacterium]|nr:hypothetical protein [Paracoccaceae bacterium]